MRGLVFVLLVGCGSSSAVIDATGDDGAAVADGQVDAPGALRPLRGTNMSGAEFGTAVPGTFGVDYIYPDPTYVASYASQDYFVGKGMNTFRVPFRWERLQRQLNAELDATELARLDTTVGHMTGKLAYVIIEPHNFARYNDQLVGSTAVPNAAFADLWSRLAQHYAGNSRVMFGLVNEPHDMPTEQWRDGANAAIAAIRAAGAHNLILVPGNAYTGAWSWTLSYYGTPNAVAMLGITDPDDNYAFEVHQYLDSDYSGSHTTCQSTTIGAESLAGFTAWLREHGKRGMLGELGAAANSTCASAVDGMLAHLDANADVYLGWTWWSAGPWWGNYFMTLEPQNGVDAPQLATLAAHL
ncbi:MAG TPA: glycoside hydrolase family 5 protein [Kofleriaceae bacterium]